MITCDMSSVQQHLQQQVLVSSRIQIRGARAQSRASARLRHIRPSHGMVRDNSFSLFFSPSLRRLPRARACLNPLCLADRHRPPPIGRDAGMSARPASKKMAGNGGSRPRAVMKKKQQRADPYTPPSGTRAAEILRLQQRAQREAIAEVEGDTSVKINLRTRTVRKG